jgi:hypothetical protein
VSIFGRLWRRKRKPTAQEVTPDGTCKQCGDRLILEADMRSDERIGKVQLFGSDMDLSGLCWAYCRRCKFRQAAPCAAMGVQEGAD